jgi:transposase
MSTEQSFETKRIDHLGIVAGIRNEIELIETIDRVVSPGERKVSCGQSVQAMVLNALGFTSRALYLMPQYLDNKPVDLLISPELEATDFNDDSLGRSMEALSGNQSDKESFPDTIQAFCQQLKSGERCFYVVYSALYAAANLQSLGDIRWLTCVPETLAEAKRLLAKTQRDQMTALSGFEKRWKYHEA